MKSVEKHSYLVILVNQKNSNYRIIMKTIILKFMTSNVSHYILRDFTELQG